MPLQITVTNDDGSESSKTVFWMNIPVDLNSITKVEPMDEADPYSVLAYGMTESSEGLQMNAYAVGFDTTQQARKAHEQACKALQRNLEREGSQAWKRSQ